MFQNNIFFPIRDLQQTMISRTPLLSFVPYIVDRELRQRQEVKRLNLFMQQMKSQKLKDVLSINREKEENT